MRMTANTTTAASTVLPSEMAMSPPAVFFRLREAGSETSALAGHDLFQPFDLRLDTDTGRLLRSTALNGIHRIRLRVNP